MRVAFHLAHPAHYHLFRHAAEALTLRHDVLVTYNEKDILGELLRRQPIGGAVRSVRARAQGGGVLGLARQFWEKEVGLYREARAFRPDILLGTSIIIAHVGRLLGIPSVIVNEDDFDVVSTTAAIGYPFCSHILAPRCCRTGRWAHKVVAHDSYHELAYLGPARFVPDRSRLAPLEVGDRPFFILRFSGLSAHHDVGKTGITGRLAERLVAQLEAHGRVFITSERPLDEALEPYRIRLDPLDIHHALAFATLYVGDSQTMAAEAAVLGTPSIRFNDFVGRLGYLEELEHRYGLTYGIRTSEPAQLHAKVEELLRLPGLGAEWARRRERMLEEKTDFASYLTWFIEHFPGSAAREGAGARAPAGVLGAAHGARAA